MLYNHRKQTESGGGEKVRLNADQGATRSSRVDQHTVLLNFFQEVLFHVSCTFSYCFLVNLLRLLPLNPHTAMCYLGEL